MAKRTPACPKAYGGTSPAPRLATTPSALALQAGSLCVGLFVARGKAFSPLCLVWLLFYGSGISILCKPAFRFTADFHANLGLCGMRKQAFIRYFKTIVQTFYHAQA